jgi:sugar/nucleoside kinase (ribokinase family)
MSGRVLCLGDPLVELVCERPADAFVPRIGGGATHAGVVAARRGASVAVAGGVGPDIWGEWLRAGLVEEGVDLELLVSVERATTPVAFIFGPGADYARVGAPVAGAGVLGGRLADAAAAGGAVVVATDALVVPEDRAAVMAAREVALDVGVPIVLDVGLHRGSWRSSADAAASANACVPGSLLVLAGAADAEAMTGESDPERAALALLKAGARLVVLVLDDGVLLRGELRADVDTERRCEASVLTGVLLARLAGSDFYPPAVAAALREAVAVATRP